jgi:hypothetical protein
VSAWQFIYSRGHPCRLIGMHVKHVQETGGLVSINCSSDRMLCSCMPLKESHGLGASDLAGWAPPFAILTANLVRQCCIGLADGGHRADNSSGA